MAEKGMWRQMDGGEVGKEPLRFTLRWDAAMGCYRVSVPNIEGPLQVVPASVFDEAVARAERAEALLERLIRAYKNGTTDDMARVLADARAALDAGGKAAS